MEVSNELQGKPEYCPLVMGGSRVKARYYDSFVETHRNSIKTRPVSFRCVETVFKCPTIAAKIRSHSKLLVQTSWAFV